MRWSYRIGRIFGIDVRVHGMFLVLFAVLGLSEYLANGAAAALDSLAVFAVVFGLVLLHELGHSLMAKRYGVQVHDITLWPLGGMARLEEIPEDPATEIKISVAGPAVNFGIALILLALMALVSRDSTGPGPPLGRMNFLLLFTAISLIMGTFNLLPAFPMDGGRILRALLARRYDYLTATEKAARVGRWIAVAMGITALFFPNQLMLLVLAVFIYVAGSAEVHQVRMKHMFAASRARTTPFSVPRPFPGAHGTERPLGPNADVAERFRRLAEDLDRIVNSGPRRS